MFEHLQIYVRRERWAVGVADAALACAAAVSRSFGRRAPRVSPPGRILLLRLERIGDLLMAWPAIAAVRRLAPAAQIDLVVGSWNAAIARLNPNVDRVETLDAKWLSRGGAAPGLAAMFRRAGRWRDRGYDLAINFEGDIRSHVLMSRTRAPRRVGFDMAGGGPVLTDRVPHDPRGHVADNLLRLVEAAFDLPAGSLARTEERIQLPREAYAGADAFLHRHGNGGPLVGIQVGGGREIKQWSAERFGELAARLAAAYGVPIVFTGVAGDRRLVDRAIAQLPKDADVLDACGRMDLLTLAALLSRLSVFVTCDTGPMHLAAAVGTPLVAIFGPSDPRRWGPLSATARVVCSDVSCRPCNRIRRPPADCVGKLPDCLAAIDVDQVFAATAQALGEARATAGSE